MKPVFNLRLAVTLRRRLRLCPFASERGSALMEVAIMLPIFMTLLTGICSFVLVYGRAITLTHAVGSGGMRLQQLRSASTDPCLDTFNAIKDAATSLDSTKIGLTVSFNTDTTPYTPTQTGNSCPGAQSYLGSRSKFTITATYPVTFFGFMLPTTNKTLTATDSEYVY